MWDDDAGYDTNDPKHPGYHDLWAGYADDARKAARESVWVNPAEDDEAGQ